MKLFWSGGREAENGVGIVVAEHLIDKVTEVRRIGDRMMLVRIVFGMAIFSIVSVYAPQQGDLSRRSRTSMMHLTRC